ncbi:AAA family ATPase [Pseudomonas sp. KNUC1026]|uniref:AAA family ATPase n=1 Tax=Pseudomonas sp. KNUC1026 TaxID=2893890 RepID=UPI001F461A6E|nr:AAA family ATPase [Pseudomonas sp. KNUC1026]UFH48133.1 AAA family ATPase [Pseudomonas sp. KNUC1026]
MKIKQLTLTHYRRFRSFRIDFDEQVTVLVARNGAGKSSILDALATALGLYLTRLPGVSGISPRETDFQVDPDGSKPAYMRIECESFSGVKWDRTEKRDKSAKTEKQIPPAMGHKALMNTVDAVVDAHNEGRDYSLPIFAHYGTNRAVFDIPQRKRAFKNAFSRFDAFDGALQGRANFKRLIEYFYFLEDCENREHKARASFAYEHPELRAIRQAISRLMPAFTQPRSVYPAGLMVNWTVDNTVKQLRIEQLSDGYRTTLAMVMDIAARMAEANPASEEPLNTEGVILIDEVDLHLHPGWQQQILPDLMKTFPNVQFIVTTHSPQVVSSVKPESLRVIDWQGEEARLIPVNFSFGAESQQMLTQVLGVEPRSPVKIVQQLYEYQQLVAENQWDSDRGLELRRILDDWGAEYEPELLRLEMDIRLKALDRDQLP